MKRSAPFAECQTGNSLSSDTYLDGAPQTGKVPHGPSRAEAKKGVRMVQGPYRVDILQAGKGTYQNGTMKLLLIRVRLVYLSECCPRLLN
jgi:hypothetical protein